MLWYSILRVLFSDKSNVVVLPIKYKKIITFFFLTNNPENDNSTTNICIYLKIFLEIVYKHFLHNALSLNSN